MLACVECCRRIPAACVGTARRALRAMFRKTRLKLNVQVAWCAARLFLRTTRALCQDAAFIVNPSKRLNLRMCRSKSRLCRHQLAWPLKSPSLAPPADPPPDSSPTLWQCLECRAVSQKKNNASHCVEILEEGFPHSDLVKCGIW